MILQKLHVELSFFLWYSNGQYIVAGSDDGSFFIWDKATTNIVRVLRGDDSIVNCLEPHPVTCLLATSGIDPVVRLWSPRPEVGNFHLPNFADLCCYLFLSSASERPLTFGILSDVESSIVEKCRDSKESRRQSVLTFINAVKSY